MSRCRNNPAFTLIEAVVALAIMSVSAFALLTAASRCLAVARSAKNLHSAISVLDRGELEFPLKPTNEVMDNVVDPVAYDEKYTFERSVDPFGEEKDLFLIRTKVSWSRKGKQASEQVETLLFSTNHAESFL